ncbi:uncharacterized protein Z520_06380 [Fonsecaea multimorphosa CBS 102226]|uniref:Uncharacterized protein n=1 Tax=Fonsecaea multimorphosa CBS 102226 TaxID=1442371 RepID=A0A0D2JVV7_9EURO|nr:uncharacterized protein Z520_06380 [Fonsecaea multimorphosa CBS 102226]KIX97602.1 hypothetical protein Z520_06380 [Fonsecaea multimorphosa CBS 102226]
MDIMAIIYYRITLEDGSIYENEAATRMELTRVEGKLKFRRMHLYFDPTGMLALLPDDVRNFQQPKSTHI